MGYPRKIPHSYPIGSMYAIYIYGVPWIPSIYPSHVSIEKPAPAGSVMGFFCVSHRSPGSDCRHLGPGVEGHSPGEVQRYVGNSELSPRSDRTFHHVCFGNGSPNLLVHQFPY